jgi:uncharacterized tellurite resistance protein B-like protein
MDEEELEQLIEDWQRIRKELSELKKENSELKEDLRNTVLLARALYEFSGTDKTMSPAENLRTKIVNLLSTLHKRLGIDPP